MARPSTESITWPLTRDLSNFTLPAPVDDANAYFLYLLLNIKTAFRWGSIGANDELFLAATAYNLRKMAKLDMNGYKMSSARRKKSSAFFMNLNIPS